MSSLHSSVFRRSEHALAHAVYGLIMTIAVVGQLIHHDVSAWASVWWLLGTGAVLFGAHLVSDFLARLAATRQNPGWDDLKQVGGSDLAVVIGPAASAVIMLVTALANLDAKGGQVVCVVTGLALVGILTYYATQYHHHVVRLGASAVAVGFAALIVVGENAI